MASAQADQWRRLAGTFRRTFNFPITARQDWEALEFDISFCHGIFDNFIAQRMAYKSAYCLAQSKICGI